MILPAYVPQKETGRSVIRMVEWVQGEDIDRTIIMYKVDGFIAITANSGGDKESEAFKKVRSEGCLRAIQYFRGSCLAINSLAPSKR